MSDTPPLLVAMAGGKPRARRERIPVPRESRLHKDVADLLQAHCLPDWRWRHISAKAADAREGAIMKRMGVKPGWPDFILLTPYGSPMFIELKRPGETPSEAQLLFRAWCQTARVPHVVAWTMDDVLRTLTEWGCLRVSYGGRA